MVVFQNPSNTAIWHGKTKNHLDNQVNVWSSTKGAMKRVREGPAAVVGAIDGDFYHLYRSARIFSMSGSRLLFSHVPINGKLL